MLNFHNAGPLRILEVGIGTGPNLKYLKEAIQGAGAEAAPSPVASGAPGAPGTAPGAATAEAAGKAREVVVSGIDPNPAMLVFAKEASVGLRIWVVG